MKRILLICFAIMFLLTSAGCTAEEAVLETEPEIAQEEPKIDDKYEQLIFALNNNNYDAAAEMVEAFRLQHYGEAVAAGEVQEFPVTAENWGQFFELREITQWQQDESGRATGFITHVCVTLRDEYVDLLIAEKTNIQFNWQARCSVKNCTVDLDNRIVHLENEFKSQTTTFGEAEILQGTVSFSGAASGTSWCNDAYVAAEIGEILIIGEYNLKGEQKPVCYDYDDTAITNAQGLLVLRASA